MLEAAQARADSLENRLIAELSGAAQALESSRQIEAQTETTLVPLTEASLRAARVGYENGRVDFATLLEAQRATRKIKQDLIRVRADQQARLADLEKTDWRYPVKRALTISRPRVRAARGARCRLLAGTPHHRRRAPWLRRTDRGEEDPLLPQSDGARRHLPDPEEGPDGDGLHPGLRRRRRWQRAQSARQIRISADKVQKLGVCTERVTERALSRELRALGRIEIDESHINAVAPRFEGWVERLHVNVTGQAVVKGQALVRCLEPGAGVRAERIRDRPPERGGDEKRRTLGPREHQRAGRRFARPFEELGPLRRRDPGPLPPRPDPTGADAALAGLGHRDREEGSCRGCASRPAIRSTRSRICRRSGSSLTRTSRTSPRFRLGQKARITVSAYPGKEFIGRVSFVSPTLKSEDAHGVGPRRTRQSRRTPQARAVRGGNARSPAGGPRADRPQLGAHRQRHPPDRAGAGRRRPFRAAHRQAGRALGRLRRSARWRQERRSGRRRRELPDRCGEQSESRPRQLRARRRQSRGLRIGAAGQGQRRAISGKGRSKPLTPKPAR